MTTNKTAEVETISLLAHEVQAERFTRIIKGIIAGWILTIALFVTAIICLLH